MTEYDNSELKAQLEHDTSEKEQFLDRDEEPVAKNQWGHYGEFEIVGNGSITNPDPNSSLQCGRFYGFVGCDRVEEHNVVTLDGVNHSGKVYVKKRFHYCNNPRCPVCYKSGWASREAKNIEKRLEGCSRTLGKAEHIIISVPTYDYGLSYEKLRTKVEKELIKHRVAGGVLICHGFRYDKWDGWYWSPHFHCLGFIKGGYGKCRGCKYNHKYGRDKCQGCDGWEGHTRRKFEEERRVHGNGYIVKVKDKRITIVGTAWYQLNHATLKSKQERFHIATWFGACSYRKMKLTKEKIKELELCPICNWELKKLRYKGYGLKAIKDEFWIKEFETPAYDKETGEELWEEKPSESYGYY